MKGIYRFDESKPTIDAFILSHSHSDHASCISFLNREIPIYCGRTTERLLKSLSEVKIKNFETDIEGLQINSFRTGDKIKIGNLEIKPIHVDHSVPAAYGFIIHTSEGAILYTGDFRVHGAKAKMTHDFIKESIEENSIGMICEGTNISGADVSSEDEVKTKVRKVVKSTDKLVLADFSYADIDRFRTFYEIAREFNRQLVISTRQAYIFDKLRHDDGLDLPEIDDENLLIFQKSKKRLYRWEERIVSHFNVSDSNHIKKIQEKVIIVCSLFDLKELIDIRPEAGSNFIHSTSEPVNEEGEIEYSKLLNWLDHFGLPLYQIHCSGHIMPNEIKETISKIKPTKIYPIHTEHPELFAKFIAKCGQVELPHKQL